MERYIKGTGVICDVQNLEKFLRKYATVELPEPEEDDDEL